MLILLLVVSCVLVSGSAFPVDSIAAQTTVLLGPCPEVTTMTGFEVQRYLGKWYEISKTSGISFERDQKCITANYEPRVNDTGVITVTNRGFNKDTNVAMVANGRAFQINKKEPAKLLVSFISGSDSLAILAGGPYWVLDTDYNTYTVIHSCTDYFGLFHSQLNWILARDRQIQPEVLATAMKVFEDQSIDTSAMVTSDQTGCSS